MTRERMHPDDEIITVQLRYDQMVSVCAMLEEEKKNLNYTAEYRARLEEAQFSMARAAVEHTRARKKIV